MAMALPAGGAGTTAGADVHGKSALHDVRLRYAWWNQDATGSLFDQAIRLVDGASAGDDRQQQGSRENPVHAKNLAHRRRRRKRSFYEGRPPYTGLVRRIAAAVPPLENRSPRSAPKTQARSITNLVKITDDDADRIITTERLKKKRRYSLDRVLRENGYKLER
jgi:hypothetical protein